MSHLTSARTYDPFKLGIRVYGFPAVMVLIGLVPVANALAYSGHGGPAWLALPLTFPYVLLRLGLAYSRSTSSDRPRVRRFGIVSVPTYVVVSAPLSWAATYSINAWLGTSLPWTQFWAAMLLPASLVVLLFR